MPGSRARPHIVHVFPGFGVGGSQVRFAAIAAGLGDGFSHTIVSLDGRLDAVSHLDPGLDVKIAPPLAAGGGFRARLKRHRSQLSELSADLLVTYNWGAIEVALANFGRSTPHLHVEDGFGPEEAIRQFPRRIWMRRLALSRSQVVVPSATLNEIGAHVWRLNQRRVHWIPNGIAERDAWSTSLKDLRLDLPPGLPIIVWAGAMRLEKNPLRLLRAFAPIKDKAVLLMIGDGPERDRIEAEIQRLGLAANTRLLGYRTDARDLIMQGDIMVLTSDTEQMPLVVLEAMDGGVAVVSTDVGDVRRMVAPINAPFVTASETELADALSTLVGDEDLRTRIGLANRAKCRDDYALGTMIGAWRSLFEKHARPARA